MSIEDRETWTIDTVPSAKNIDDIDLHEYESGPILKFFVAVLAVSQLIFFSSVGPMIMDMFSDVPIRFRDLVALFVIRTAILVPLIALMTHAVNALGLL